MSCEVGRFDWFTDPAYGIDTDYEGIRPVGDRRAVTSTRRRQIRAVTGSSPHAPVPNGIASRPTRIPLCRDTGATHKENGPQHIRRFGVDAPDCQAANLSRVHMGLYDGFRIDRSGRICDSSARGSIATTRLAR